MHSVATPVPEPLAGELVGDGPGEAGTGGAQRVAERDGAALRVEDRRVELGPLGDAAEDLGGERLVQFEDGEVAQIPCPPWRAPG